MAIQHKLTALLADGAIHSGTNLAAQLGVTRAAVWKSLRQLEALGVEVDAQAGRGYQLTRPLELLDYAAIEKGLVPECRSALEALDVFWSIESTSDHLLAQPILDPGRARLCFAEYQAGGRGRQQRAWFAAPGQGLCLSLAWSFAENPGNLQCLSLAVGVAVLRAIRACGFEGAELKWPNDVLIDGRKLAGILVDVKGEVDGPLHVVVGVGLNYRMDAKTAAAIGAAGGLKPVGLLDSAEALNAQLRSRNELAAGLANELFRVMGEFAAAGFAALVDDWRNADYLRGKEIRVVSTGQDLTGIACGIESDGRLGIKTAGGMVHVLSGDISVREAG